MQNKYIIETFTDLLLSNFQTNFSIIVTSICFFLFVSTYTYALSALFRSAATVSKFAKQKAPAGIRTRRFGSHSVLVLIIMPNASD